MRTNIDTPFFTTFDREKNILINYDAYEERRLSDMQDRFENEAVRKKNEESDNQLVYSVYRKNVPECEGELLHCITVIQAGDVNGELFMTRGHYHKNDTCAEIYYGQKGNGLLLMQSAETVKVVEMFPDTIAYIPAGWGHRTINIGNEPFVFFSIWPGNSGYDYQRSADNPFINRIYRKMNSYEIK